MLKKLESLREEADLIYKQFTSCQTFKESKGILTEAKRAIDFYEGRQWIDNKTKLPFEKPSLNIIQTIIDSKVASINQKSYKVNFMVDNDQISTNNVSRFAEFQMKEMEQGELNIQATYDGLLKGTFIYYFYWDNEAVGQMGNIEGALKAIMVDVEDIAVSNPNERDINKQEWIILRTRESIKSIKDMCDTLTDKEANELITKDSVNSTYTNNIEQDNEPSVYSYTKFFRQKGEIYFEKATKEIVYQKPTSMNPLINEEIIKTTKKEQELEENDGHIYASDSVNRSSMNMNDIIENTDVKYKALYYPFVIDSFLRRNNCIFGRSMAYQLIPIQKIVNQLLATNVLNAVKSAVPTLLVKQGALGTSDVDLSKPGGVLVDRSVGQNGWGITALQTGSIPTTHFELAQNLVTLTKDVYRASDVLDDGRNISSKMSGYALSQLQTIQDKPVAQLQEILSRAIGKEGRILEMFYKLFYRNKVYSYELTDTELLQQFGQAQDTNQVDVTQLPRTTNAMFNGVDYLETPFNVTVEVEETAKQSELMLVSTLETLFLNGTVSKLSPEDLMMWAELVPNYAFTKKDEFKRLIQQKMNSQIAQLQQVIQQQQEQLQNAQIAYQSLKDEFNGKVSQYNDNIRRMQAGYNALQKQASRYKQNLSQNEPAQ